MLSDPNAWSRSSACAGASASRSSTGRGQKRSPAARWAAARRAAGQRDHAVAVGGELAHVERGLAAVEALEEAGRGELDEVPVADVVLGQQREVVALAAPRAAGRAVRMVVDEVDLAAHDRLDAVLRARLVELDRAVHHAVVGQAERGLAELGGPRGERLDVARAVEQRVLRVDVEVGAGRRAHGTPRIGGGAAGPAAAPGKIVRTLRSAIRGGRGSGARAPGARRSGPAIAVALPVAAARTRPPRAWEPWPRPPADRHPPPAAAGPAAARRRARAARRGRAASRPRVPPGARG